MIGRQQEILGSAPGLPRLMLGAVVVELSAGDATLLLADVVDWQVLARFADVLQRLRGCVADEPLAQVDEHVHVAAADVVRVDLVAAEEQLVRPLVRVLVGVRVLVRLLAHEVVDPHHRVEVIVLDAAAGAEDDVQIRDLGGRQREARQGVLLEAERLDAPAARTMPVRQQAERLAGCGSRSPVLISRS